MENKYISKIFIYLFHFNFNINGLPLSQILATIRENIIFFSYLEYQNYPNSTRISHAAKTLCPCVVSLYYVHLLHELFLTTLVTGNWKYGELFEKETNISDILSNYR